MPAYSADSAWLPHRWAPDVRLETEGAALVRVQADAKGEGAEHFGRYVVPGMPNLHSHAFQRAMAGLTERQSAPRASGAAREEQVDSFW
ncbi:MAG: formimidoylglutamate deiminase, partial [Rhodanobacteraceae bacterium]